LASIPIAQYCLLTLLDRSRGGRTKPVTDAVYCFDYPRLQPRGCQFAAEILYVCIDISFIAGIILTGDGIHELAAA
jgi:hypothetical protein